MKVGVIVPQGWTGEYAGMEPRAAWQRTVEVAQAAHAEAAHAVPPAQGAGHVDQGEGQ